MIKECLIFFILIFSISTVIGLEKESIAYLGDQVDPHVDGKYVVYLKSTQKDATGKPIAFNIFVHDSGKTIDSKDDVGELELTKDGAQHKYSNPVIAGRYIAWLDNNKDIYIYDMGEDEQINIGNDPGIKKLNIIDEVNDDALKRREYTKKDNLAISMSGKVVAGRTLRVITIVNFDGIRNDKVELKDMNSGLTFLVTILAEGVGTININGRAYNIKYFDDRNVIDDEYIEISGPDITTQKVFKGQDVIIGAQNDELNEFLVWDDFDSLHGDKDVRGYKMDKSETLIVSDDKVVTVGGSDYQVDESDPYIVNGRIAFVKNDFTDLGDFGVSEENEVYSVLLGINTISSPSRISNLNDGCNALQPSINKKNIADTIWVESCGGIYQIVRNGQRVVGVQGIGVKYYSPLIFADSPLRFGEDDNLYYVEESATQDLLLKSAQGELSTDGILVVDTKIDLDRYRLVFSEKGNDVDVGVIKIFKFLGHATSDLYMVADNLDGAILAWNLLVGFGVIESVVAQFVKSDGILFPNSATIISQDAEILSTGRAGLSPSIFISDGQGGAIVFLERFDEVNKGHYINIYFLKPDGTLKFANPILITTEPNNYFSAVSDKQGGALLQYSKYSFVDNKNLITRTIQFLNPDGTIVPAQQVDIPNPDIFIDRFPDNKGGAIVTWDEFNVDTQIKTLYAQFIKRDGTKSDKIKIYESKLFNGTIVNSDNRGGLIYAMREVDSITKTNIIKSQFLNADGTLRFASPIKVFETKEDIALSSIISDDNGGAIIFWTWFSSNQGLFAQFIKSDGNLLMLNPVKVNDRLFYNRVISNNLGGAIILWETGGRYGYIQFMDFQGNLVFKLPIEIIDQLGLGSVLINLISDTKGGAIVSYIAQNKDMIIVKFLDVDGNLREFSVPIIVQNAIFHNAEPKSQIPKFIRGDSNNDGNADMSDAIFILQALFTGGKQPTCEDAADIDDTGIVDMSDAIYLLQRLFLGGALIPQPADALGEDPTADGLSCKCYGATCLV